MEENKKPQQLSIDIDPSTVQGVYSNAVFISHSPSDFVLDFAQILPGLNKPKVASRMIVAPEHAKRLLMALNENIMKYEQQFGKIQIHGQGAPSMIAPFAQGNN